MRKTLLLSSLAVFCLPAFAQPTGPGGVPFPPIPAAADSVPAKIEPNATIYISPMDGFENDLQAAFLKKHVPLIMVGDKSKATYIVEGHNDNQKAGWAKTLFVTPAPSEHASITIKRISDDSIVYAYSVDKLGARHGPQSSAEACAKHLREAIEGK